MTTVIVNGVTVSVPSGCTVLQACELAGFGDDIPRFCYHKRLGVAGNCRRCLVEIDKSPKPQASCARPVRNNRAVFTNSAQVKKARESVMEFLLRHHPLDCPICDQGGECDLQDQAMAYGSDRSRYSPMGVKRSVEDKDWGPLVKTVMTRCIQCTRCVRFASEIAGVPVVGATGRGNEVEIGMYAEKPFLSEISGNVVDLCPVGALTASGAGVHFNFRPWELQSVEGLDFRDSCLTPVTYQHRGGILRRVLPSAAKSEDAVWLSDKGRYSPLDGSMTQRITKPYIRSESPSGTQRWRNRSISEAKRQLNELCGARNASVRIVFGGTVDCSTVVAMTKWCESSKVVRLETLAPLAPSQRSDKESSKDGVATLPQKETAADKNQRAPLLLVGYNPRVQSVLNNVKLREYFLEGTTIVSVGGSMDLTYQHLHLGFGLNGIRRRRAGLERKALGSDLHASAELIKAGGKLRTALIGSDVFRRYSFKEGLAAEGIAKEVLYGYTRANEAYIAEDLTSNNKGNGGLIAQNVSSLFSSSGVTNSVAGKFNLQIFVGISESEVESAGFGIDQRLKASTYNVVVSAQGAEWMKQANRILPVLNDLETRGLYALGEAKGLADASGTLTTSTVKKYVARPAVNVGAEGVGTAVGVFGTVLPYSESKASRESENGNVDYVKLGNFIKERANALRKARINSSRETLPLSIAMVDHHLEGHSFAEASPTMARCSAVFASHAKNFRA